jgi:hypothetical protein
LFGRKPLNIPQKKTLDEFYNSVIFSLEQDSSTDDLIHDNYNSLEIYMRKGRIEESFKKYSYGLANFREFITENDFILPDAILTDIWLKLFYTVSFKIDEFYLFLEMMKIFHKFGESYSLKVLKNHIRDISIQELKDKIFSRFLIDWQKDLSKIERIYLSLSNRSAAFTYRLNRSVLGLSTFYFFVRFSKGIKKEIIDFAFKNMTGLVQSSESRFDGSVINDGLIGCRIQDYAVLNEFFESLKLNHIIDEYVFFKRTLLSFNFNFRDKKNSKNSLYTGFLIDYEKNKNIWRPDIIDFVLFQSLTFNYVGLRVDFERTDFFIEKMKNELRITKTQLKKQSDIFKKMTEINVNVQDIKILIPLDFKRKEKIEKVKPKYLTDIISKKYGVLAVKFIYDNIFNIFSIFHKFFRDQEQKFSNFDNIKDFLDRNQLSKKDTESYILLKHSFSSLDKFFLKTSKELNFRSWIFSSLLFFEKNLEKFEEIMDILQILCDYIKIINLPYNEKNLIHKIEALINYLKQTRNEIHLDLENRIHKMKEHNLIVPDIFNSIAMPNLYIQKTLLLKNIEMEDKRIHFISKQFPKIEVVFSQNSNPKYVFIKFRAHSELNKMIYDTIKYLFKENLVFFTALQGKIHDVKFDNHIFYNFQMKSFNSLKPNFDSINNFLLNFKKNIADYPDKIFKISSNNKSVTKFDKSKDLIYKSEKNKIMPVLKENYIKNDEKKKRLSKIIHDTEKEFAAQFDLSKKQEFKDSVLKYRGYPNFGHFNMSFYLVQTTILKKSFTIKDCEDGFTNKFLLTPGFLRIKTSTDLGSFQQTFVEYITPREDPPIKIFNYALRRKIISKFRVMRIMRMHVIFNPSYFFDDIWNYNFEVWDKLSKKIITNPKYQFDPGFKTINFETDVNKTYSQESVEFETAAKSFDNSLRVKFVGNIKQMIDSGLISPIPWFDLNKLQLNEKVIVFFEQINVDQKKKILMIFSMLPQVNIFEIDYFESDNITVHHIGLYLELNLPNSRLDQLYFSIYDLSILLDIKNYQFIPGVIDLTPQEFTDGQIKKRLNPLQSHLWSKRTKRWRKIRYFDKNGIPLKYQERIKQLNKWGI